MDVKNLELLSSLLSEASSSINYHRALKKKKMKYCRAKCPDPQCNNMMYFPTHELSVECGGCGQRHSTDTLSDRQELKDDEQFQKNLSEIKMLYGGKKTAELVKVKGISNYQCKLLSPLLTTHGKDKNDQPRLLNELGMGPVFDCSKLSSRAFAIEQNLLATKGYGQDKSGSQRYLNDTLNQISAYNQGRPGLVPVHADGDGHCLVHAISRCLVGRELFWHALRQNMKDHLETNRDQYIELMKDFLSEEEWPEIVNEAAPDYQPPDGQALGLRTVHIFALANVLHRPIILLDSIAGMQTKGEYSGIFLPALLSPDVCMTNNVLNSPIVIAWSNAGYNHFIPLVPIKDDPLPKLPLSLRPEVWGVNESLLSKYIKIENDGSIEVGRGKPLQDSYLQKLVACMEHLFFSIHQVIPSLVADFNQHVYRSAGYVAMSPDMVTMETKMAINEGRLFQCLICSGLSCVPDDWLTKNGTLYDIAAGEYSLKPGERYTFPRYGVTAEYNETKDVLVPYDVDCFLCKQTARVVNGKGEVAYQNGDRTPTRANPQFSKCCGYKHYWNGNEYDNLPEVYPLQLTWKGRQKTIKIYWFQNESDPSLNSNMYEVASKVVAENYPAEFGDEQLVQQVVEMLLQATEAPPVSEFPEHSSSHEKMETEPPNVGMMKAISSGMSSVGTRVLHKEELGVSETERQIKRRVEEKLQSRKNTSPNDKTTRKTSPTPSSPSPISPPSKSSGGTNHTPKPSPPSPSIPSNTKKIRVTTSDGKTANLTLSNTATFIDLQTMIEDELGIPSNCQRLRWGFPPKELRPSENDEPLTLSHGERVSVEWTGHTSGSSTKRLRGGDSPGAGTNASRRQPKVPSSSSSSLSSSNSLIDQINLLLSDVKSLEHIQKFPNLFRKGGHCYEEFRRSYGKQLVDGMHVQFSEMPDITFRFNKIDECLEVCLGVDHVPVGSLTKAQMELARQVAQQNASDHGSSDSTMKSDVESVKWMLNRPGSGSNVKAFSGAGRTLGGGDYEDASLEDSGEDDAGFFTDELLGRAQQLLRLKNREGKLQDEVRALNQRLLNIHSGNEAVDDEDLSNDLERRLLSLSSELKQVRDELRSMPNL